MKKLATFVAVMACAVVNAAIGQPLPFPYENVRTTMDAVKKKIEILDEIQSLLDGPYAENSKLVDVTDEITDYNDMYFVSRYSAVDREIMLAAGLCRIFGVSKAVPSSAFCAAGINRHGLFLKNHPVEAQDASKMQELCDLAKLWLYNR